MSAIAAGDKVRPRLISAEYPVNPVTTLALAPQPPHFGFVLTAGGGNVLVSGDNGLLVPPTGTIKDTSLQRIVAPDTTVRDTWLNKIVLPLGFSQEYTAKVVDIFAVDTGGQTVVKEHHIVCRTLTSDMYFDAAVVGNPLLDPEILTDR